jgi:hypothetical protein
MEVPIIVAAIGALVWPSFMARTLYERYHEFEYRRGETFADRVRINLENIHVPRTLGWALLMSVVGAVLGYVFGAGLATIFL